ncbi:MAG: hypothetical protein HY235_13770 [Acidobacteria bacterium]|nr:hypothetical protein [Acidobacteriota bacterium]
MAVFDDVLAEIVHRGLLLVTDCALPNVVTLVVGEPVRGSWWGHPMGKVIYQVLVRLDAHPDVTSACLVNGKVTFVQRRLWPELLAVAISRETWQMRGLTMRARRLLAAVEAGRQDRSQDREAIRELEKKLLIRTVSVHTGKGHHEKRLQSWGEWAAEHKIKAANDLQVAKRRLERVLGKGLPWQSP